VGGLVLEKKPPCVWFFSVLPGCCFCGGGGGCACVGVCVGVCDCVGVCVCNKKIMI